MAGTELYGCDNTALRHEHHLVLLGTVAILSVYVSILISVSVSVSVNAPL